MSMKSMEDLRHKLCEELEEVARKPEMGAGDLELAHKLTDTIKNIDKICIMDEDGGYSMAGDWEARMNGTYGDYSQNGNRYSSRGRHRDSHGRYSGRGYSRTGYSMAGGKEAMLEHVEDMMEEATDDRTREMVRRFKQEIERM